MHDADSRAGPRRRVLAVVAGLSVGGCFVAIEPNSALVSPVLAVLAWYGARWLLNRPVAAPEADPLVLAAAWDIFAACLKAGMPVPAAVRIAADRLSGRARAALAEAADLLALGADPTVAWQAASALPETTRLARAARGTARSGAALAQLARELATAQRATAADQAESLAQRAAVLMSAPLGACFLPAFLCLGVAPVVAGLANGLMAAW
ncbi:type II secretion system F family protein [Allokutzneria sp. A3M-2-11 16]|uniref:type II secretion system F family protein n=1 Tax=Allokutzneria sp. A3M-2-11 16 TaxID=2962043 RepID=UPI0020B8611F|nr:type II secretion system F family protein [Allokutzneria sp. A3M-2-11 16]MCP3799883.1 type II secretion system F family protein [Allokutzneria sp. A3M-2-11 16]